MELIVSEKGNAARRIAEILSNGRADVRRIGGVGVHAWDDNRCLGLSGHVVGVDFPDEYQNWSAVEPAELIDAEIVKTPTRKDIVSTLKRLARDADRVVIATDYDREGELIGKEAVELVRDVNPDVPVDRVRFSSLSDTEVTAAFADRDEIDYDLAAAGEARQIIDLIWGAALTRFLSIAAKRYGEDFISVGRVQSPTLKLLVDREREIEAFEPDDYWELFADLHKDGEDDAFEAQYYYLDADDNEAERIWDGTEAEAVYAALEGAESATVREVDRRTRTRRPPAPFNTTQFIRAAGAIGFSANRAMSIAEALYTAGYITYPRTDNTVYPNDLNPVDLLSAFAKTSQFGEDARSLLAQDSISPTRGESQTTDHPPIHPTFDLPSRGDLSKAEWRVYELVVRRFFATVAPSARWEHLRVVVRANGLALKANGKRLVEPGYHAVYPYFKTEENWVPDVAEGEELSVTETRIEQKETEPPRRYGQSRLIETMEDLGIGTKSTRHHTIDKLYDRGYVEEDPPRPTQLAKGVVDAAAEYAEQVVSESMTAQLEADMTAIAEGEASLEAVTDESREMLESVFAELVPSADEIGDRIREALKADNALGPCPECGEQLLVRTARGGSQFVGCDGYPDCEFTLPLPNKGKPLVLDERCSKHELHHVKLLAGKSTFVHGCPQCKADEADDEADRVIGICPDCGDADDGDLAIKRVRSGSRLVGCTRYPDCDYSLPLPRRGDIEVVDERCPEHDLPELVVHSGDEPWELGCPICNWQAYQAEQNNDLKSVRGIGKKTAKKLEDAGISTVEELQAADPDDLAGSVDGVSASQVRNWKTDAEA